jgi:hypothetical protein
MNQPERRVFHRILFDRDANITIGGTAFPCKIIDLSLKGALVSIADSAVEQASGQANLLGQQGVLSFALGDSDINIEMTVEIAHQEPDAIGMLCKHIDLDSISHLKRLIELNTGDDQILNRELSALLDSN